MDKEPETSRKAASPASAGSGDYWLPPRFARVNEAGACVNAVLFAAKAGRRPPPLTRPVTVTTYFGGSPKPSTSRRPPARTKLNLGAITRATGFNDAASKRYSKLHP